MSINPNYTFPNLLAFNFAGFACISFVVFLTSTQPFYLNEVIGITYTNGQIGNTIGNLGMIDELVSIVSAPLIGTLNDKINNYALTHAQSRIVSGSRLIQFASFVIIAVSLFGYGHLASKLVHLYLFRAIFAVGVTACMSMVTVMLNELSNSDFSLSKFAFWRNPHHHHHHHRHRHTSRNQSRSPEHESLLPHDTSAAPDITPTTETIDTTQRKNGKFASLIGISTGLGAIFAVSVFLTLPVKLNDNYPQLTNESSLQISYMIIAGASVLVSLLLVTFLYDSVKQHKLLKIPEETHPDDGLLTNSATTNTNAVSYFSLLYHGFQTSRQDIRIQVAFIGSFVARSTSVATSVFVPLLVYNFYYRSQICHHDDDDDGDKRNCYDGYIFAAILTGVAQTVALVSSPIWGILIDNRHVGKTKSLLLAAILGISGCIGLVIAASTGDGVYDPRNATCFVMVSLIGLSQIGTIITSMSLISGLTYELGFDVKKSMVGSISGLYSLSGGVGILLLTKLGGWWSDEWIVAPFCLLAGFNVLLALGSFISLRK